MVVLSTIVWLWVGMIAFHKMLPPSVLNVIVPMTSCWMFAVLIAVMASGRGVIGRAISVRPAVFLGEISFSVYMLHQILMKMLVTWGQAQTIPEVAFIAALILLAAASYTLVEMPARRVIISGVPAAIESLRARLTTRDERRAASVSAVLIERTPRRWTRVLRTSFAG